MEQQPITQKTAPENLKIGDKILYNGKVYKMDGTGRRFICGTDTQDKNSGVIILKNGATLDLYVNKCTRKTAPKITIATAADIEQEINAIADKWGHLDWPEQEKKVYDILLSSGLFAYMDTIRQGFASVYGPEYTNNK